jgi:hypothetical protein
MTVEKETTEDTEKIEVQTESNVGSETGRVIKFSAF